MEQKLTTQKLRELVPAAFSYNPVVGVGANYTFVSTKKIIENLEKLDWHPVVAKQDKSSDVRNSAFVKHMIRFRHGSMFDKSIVKNVGETIPEFVLINSHNRTFRFTLTFGLFRLVCSNGLVVHDELYTKINTRHIGFDFDDLAETVDSYVESFPLILEKIDLYKNIMLNRAEKIEMAKKAATFSWGKSAKVDAELLIKPKRDEDAGDSLWKVFNVIQENITKGGITYITSSGNRKATTQPITAVRRDFVFNQKFWILMEAMRISKNVI